MDWPRVQFSTFRYRYRVLVLDPTAFASCSTVIAFVSYNR